MPARRLRRVVGGVSALGEAAIETYRGDDGCRAAETRERHAGYCRQEQFPHEADDAKAYHSDATNRHALRNGISGGKAPTFAPEAERQSPARLTDEELDAAFEHLEIPDVPLEYEDDEAAGADEEMPLAVHPAGYASGVSFEQIDRAVRTASDTSATDAERREAGRVFEQIEGTELYDRLVSSSTAIGEKISGLMDCYLSQPISMEGHAEAVAVRPQNITDAPDNTDGFDIRDFV